MAALLGAARRYRPQGAGDLGDRREDALAAGAARIAVVGTDCPAITEELLDRTFEALEDADVVLGPAQDGGYYLLGVTQPRPVLFQGIAWGTDGVLGNTLRAASSAGLTTELLAPLRDVDRPEDVPPAEAELERTLSVIIPTRNEAPRLGAILDIAAQHGDAELIVADAGSTDETVAVAQARGVCVVRADIGRAHQMNAGAAASCGGLLLFCHADTHLPQDYEALLRAALATLVLGAVPGAQVGSVLSQRASPRWLRLALAVVIASSAAMVASDALAR